MPHIFFAQPRINCTILNLIDLFKYNKRFVNVLSCVCVCLNVIWVDGKMSLNCKA